MNILEMGMCISGTEVSFFASIIDEYRPGITLGRSQVKKDTPELAGKSETASLIDELKKTWFKDRNFDLQKQFPSGNISSIFQIPPTIHHFYVWINLLVCDVHIL